MPPESQHHAAQQPSGAARRFAGKRVLVTGVTGMIGANLARSLVGAGAEVHGVLRAESSRWRLAGVVQRMTLHVADLRDGAAVRRAVGASRPDVIFHLAAARATATAEERAQTVRTNVEGTQVLLDATRDGHYERFVMASSSLVCGKRDRALDERCERMPSSFFAATKAASEILAQQFAGTSGKPVVILRIFSVYGPYESPHRLIPTAILAALDDRPLSLTAPGFRRDLVYIDDVLDALFLAAAPVTLEAGEIFHIGTGYQTANEQTVSLIGKACGRTIRLANAVYSPRETDTTHWVADPAKATAVLGWRPRYSVAMGIQRTVDWMLANRDMYDAALEELSGVLAGATQ